MVDFETNFQINNKMRELCKGISIPDLDNLNKELNVLIINGLVKKYEDCVIFKKNMNKFKVDISDFIDKTGYECFMNKINLEDYILKSGTLSVIHQGFLTLLMITKLILEFKELPLSIYYLIFSINQDDKDINLHSYVLRFHKLRPGETWLQDDLNSYNEALMIFSFTKNSTLKYVNINDLKKVFQSVIKSKIVL